MNNPKNRTCVHKRANYRERAVGAFVNARGETMMNFYIVVSKTYWNKSYRANAERKRRSENRNIGE